MAESPSHNPQANDDSNFFARAIDRRTLLRVGGLLFSPFRFAAFESVQTSLEVMSVTEKISSTEALLTKVLELVAAGDELKSMKRELRGPYLSQWVLPSDPDESRDSDPDESRDDRFAVLTDRDITELEAHAEALPRVRQRTIAVLKKLFCYRDELRDCSEMQKIFGELSRECTQLNEKARALIGQLATEVDSQGKLTEHLGIDGVRALHEKISKLECSGRALMYDTEAWRAITDELDEFVSEMVAEPERNDPSTQLLLFIEEEIAKLEQRVLAALGFSPGASKRYQADLAGMGASLFDLFFENLDDYRPSGKVADEQPITLFDLTYGGCVTDFMKEWKLDDARLQRSLSMVPEWKRWSQAMLQGESPASVDEQAAQTSTEQLERSVSGDFDIEVVAEGEGYIQLAGGHGFGQLIPDAIPLNRVANSLGLSGLFMRDELQPCIALDRSDPRYNSPHQLSLPVSSEPQESVIAIKLSTGLGDVTFQVLDLEPVTISLIRGDTLYCSGSALRYLFLDAGSFLRSEFEVKFLWFDRKPNGGVEHKG